MENSQSKTEELFAQLKHHDTEHRRIDAELAEICRQQVKPLIDSGDYEAAKDGVRKFYENCTDFTFENDFVIAEINQARTRAYKARVAGYIELFAKSDDTCKKYSIEHLPYDKRVAYFQSNYSNEQIVGIYAALSE